MMPNARYPLPLHRRLLYSALVAFAALGALQAAAVVWEYAPYGARADSGGPLGLYRPHDPSRPSRPQLQPGVSLRGLLYSIHINSLGFRGPELLDPKPPAGLRLWCVGGSTTFDIYAPDDASTWPARLGARLQESLPERTVEVVNAGIPGELMEGSLEDFNAFYDRVRPDVLVIYSGPNDLRRLVGAQHPSQPVPMKKPGSGPNLALVRVVGRLLSNVRRLEAPHGGSPILPEVIGLKDGLEALIGAAQGRGSRVLLATHALQVSQHPSPEECARRLRKTALILGLPPATAAATFDAWNDLVRETAVRHGLALADVRAAVPPDGSSWGDDSHFAKAGSELAAQTMAAAFLAHRLQEPGEFRPTAP
jgi:lysophospholipase L1-like esterase